LWLVPFPFSFAISCAADYILPIAVASLHEYAGATVATALLAGAAGGYTGNYNSSGFFSGDFALGCSEKVGMALGSVAACAPSKLTAKALVFIGKTELGNAAINYATKKVANGLFKATARKAIKEAGAETIEKVTKVAAEKMTKPTGILKKQLY